MSIQYSNGSTSILSVLYLHQEKKKTRLDLSGGVMKRCIGFRWLPAITLLYNSKLHRIARFHQFILFSTWNEIRIYFYLIANSTFGMKCMQLFLWLVLNSWDEKHVESRLKCIFQRGNSLWECGIISLVFFCFLANITCLWKGIFLNNSIKFIKERSKICSFNF